MKEKLFSNLGLKLLAVILGFIVWVAVLNIDDSAVTKQIKDIPIELLNEEAIADQNQLFTITSGETVDIIIKGRKSVVSAMDKDDFIATADLSEISITNAVPIKVVAKDEHKKNSISITVVDDVMRVELEKETSASVPVIVETTGDVAEGYIAGNGIATPNLITVKGPESVVSSIDMVKLIVDVTGRNENVSTNCAPVFINKSGEEVSQKALVCDTESIEVNVPIYKIKKVAVNIDVKGDPSEGYVVTSTEYVPEMISIGGESLKLSSINSIDIDDIDITGYETNYEATIDVMKYLPEGIVVAEDNRNINVKVTIEKSIEKEIDISAENITIKNKTDNYYYEISFDNGHAVKVSGSSNVVSELTAGDLNIWIDGKELSLGENNVSPIIEADDGYTVVSSCNIVITVSAMP